MNFFGHAVVAAARSTAPAYVLGSMIPDLSAMIGGRPPRTEHAELSAGIALHHQTDHAFHGSATFRRLTAEAFDVLVARGLRRGSSRAVAHIGVEIILDGVLSTDRAPRDAYLSALDAGQALAGELSWTAPELGLRFDALRRAMIERGMGPEGSTPPVLTHRLRVALARRPLLALDAMAEPIVERWAEDFGPQICADARQMLRETEAALAVAVALSVA